MTYGYDVMRRADGSIFVEQYGSEVEWLQTPIDETHETVLTIRLTEVPFYKIRFYNEKPINDDIMEFVMDFLNERHPDLVQELCRFI